MKTISKLALVLALTGVSGLSLTVPASAAKKEEKAGPKYSPEVMKAAQVAQPAIAAKDFATAETALGQVDAAVKTDDDKYLAAALRYDMENQKLVQQQTANPNAPLNETALAGPLDALIANPQTPAADKAKYAYRRGALAYNGKQYPVALQYFAQAKQLGYTDPNLNLQITQAKVSSGDVAGGLADLQESIKAQVAAGQKPPEDYFRYGIARANQAKLPTTGDWLRSYVTAYPTAKNWRDVIVTYGLSGNSIAKLTDPQKIDLFRLMRQTKSLADQNDYLEYADDVQRRGLPNEAQTVLKEGMANGKIPAGNTQAKDLLAAATTSIKADGPIAPQEKRATAAADGKIAVATADGYLGLENYTKAAELYRLALTKGGVDADEVNTRLGIALVRGGDREGAKAAFGAVKGAPRTGIAQLWTAYLEAPAPAA
ncbi:hypothetical protein KCP91_00480 [Microvirga sp. SRT01]|uniref:Tetratricopeptide repeat protein n=1 Tax=Sphingomonas longa TaxID=2778730 RepID=A0ABS2D1R0_9SPHN|nr:MULTISPECIES: hypothetical protein [Alphaproteobacteria]MBM6574832.1 hypothetical protein [Sphingomonas sp. BT552]MBR7707884.1 hypothetical protein [Microvirga sp. SRT01]